MACRHLLKRVHHGNDVVALQANVALRVNVNLKQAHENMQSRCGVNLISEKNAKGDADASDLELRLVQFFNEDGMRAADCVGGARTCMRQDSQAIQSRMALTLRNFSFMVSRSFSCPGVMNMDRSLKPSKASLHSVLLRRDSSCSTAARVRTLSS